MKLYWLAAENRYVHRQSDIPKGVSAEQQDIATDLLSLMALLNALHRDLAQAKEARDLLGNCAVADTQEKADAIAATGAGVGIEAPEELYPDGDPVEAEPEPVVCKPRVDMSASGVLSRIDSPGVPVDDVVETIGKAPMYALKRYSGAVAVRFQELANR